MGRPGLDKEAAMSMDPPGASVSPGRAWDKARVPANFKPLYDPPHPVNSIQSPGRRNFRVSSLIYFFHETWILTKKKKRERKWNICWLRYSPTRWLRPSLHVSSRHYYKNIDLSRLGNRCCPGFPTGNASPGQKVSFFHVFLFSILFLFQLYFCISIKLIYWNSVCMISTNIYIYIITYIIFVLNSFHI